MAVSPKKIFSALRASVWSKNKEGPGPLRWIRYFNESNLTDFRTCTEGKSHGSLYMPLSLFRKDLVLSQGGWEKEKESAGSTMYCYFYWDTHREPLRRREALQCIDSIALNSFLLVAYPQISNAYAKEGTMTLKHRSKSFFLGKKRERLIRFQFVNKPSFYPQS